MLALKGNQPNLQDDIVWPSQKKDRAGQIEKQQKLLVKMTAASEDYSKAADKIYALQKGQKEAMAVNVNYTAGKERIQEIIECRKLQPKRVTACDEQLVRKLIEKITV